MNILPKYGVDTKKNADMCFGCGDLNAGGLKLKFQWLDGVARAEFTPGPVFQGWRDVVHGGILSCLLDEALNYPPYLMGIFSVTAEMRVRYRCPARVTEKLYLRAWVTKQTRKLLWTHAELRLADESVIAEADGKMFVLRQPGTGERV